MTTPNTNTSSSSNKQLPQSYAAHAVSTPTHHLTPTPAGPAATTTTPRSVASPALARPTAGLHARQVSSSAAGTPYASYKPPPQQSFLAGGAAMVSSLSQMSEGTIIGLGVSSSGGNGSGMLGASPAGGLMGFGASPAGMGSLDMLGTTPGALSSMGAAAMGLSLSDMGMSSRMRGNEDEERRMKLENVLAKLQGRKGGRDDAKRPTRLGRVSEEGVRRVGCLVGMDLESDRREKAYEGNRSVTIAGKSSALLDLSFKNNLPTKVEVLFLSENPAVEAHQEAAGKVILADLQPPPGVATINTSLDRFATNLETIAKLDKLSVSGQLNCFEAITGLYTCLQRLFEEEKKIALALLHTKQGLDMDALAEREVVCKKSGRPRMHARRKIGLSLEYWTNGKTNIMSDNNKKEEDAMDIDTAPSKDSRKEADADADADADTDTEAIYALTLTAEPNNPNMFPSIRTSNLWLSPRIHVPPQETTSPNALLTGEPSIDWQDPPPTYITTTTTTFTDSPDNPIKDAQQQQQQHKHLPSVRFVAKLNPPLALPWSTANALLQSLGAQASTDVDLTQTYTSLLLGPTLTSSSTPIPPQSPHSMTPVATMTTSVLLRDGGQSLQRRDLWVPKPDLGYVLRDLPFAHPRQIVACLPVLRQWARVGELLRGALLGPLLLPLSPSLPLHAPSLHTFTTGQGNGDGDGDGDGQNDEKVKQVVPVDITLATASSQPVLDVMFPIKGSETMTTTTAAATARVSVGVGENGRLEIGGVEGLGGVLDGGKVGRGLEVLGGDLGVWVEWLRELGTTR